MGSSTFLCHGVLYWNHYGSIWVKWRQINRECLRYLSPQIFIFTLSGCKSGLEKKFGEAVIKRWWKWKMHGAWPMWFWRQHIQYGLTWQIIYLRTKIINPLVVPIWVEFQAPCCIALRSVPAQDVFIRSRSWSWLAVMSMPVLLSVRSECWCIRVGVHP